ncbi:hypothetical protein P152DRAFT_510843 [Eremomyces bilateralis CBS 781.70]|uniref:Uncharacterized protein n=1 Tax=Eremomyces bilateralis CBS 781.70 TaxID=1392243 RepID=A0A6G1GI58_9PEZI|nr:uncharacterized protein P152DRAFT_510843 [Eremomyces bilateralis CBS 781.70]KAF1817662.1 hypothetical protein P152DRAFT_510843 [Eremomyces bilateralis CBS 781.70]
MAHAFQIRGERFHIPLDSDDEEDPVPSPPVKQAVGFSFVNDVLERSSTTPKAPAPPTVKNAAGFPAHRKRNRTSAFKKARGHGDGTAATTQSTIPERSDRVAEKGVAKPEKILSERERIDRDNQQRIAQMSPEEIEAERRELFAGLSPALVQRLLQRSTIDDEPPPAQDLETGTDDLEASEDPPTTLQGKNPLPSDPSTYSPSNPSLSLTSLRFSFSGALLPPKTAFLLPSNLGLHHHGDAPDAAGYTIPELALLARSSYPAQRCVAYRSLGALLGRLGRGEFGVLDGVDLVGAGGKGPLEGVPGQIPGPEREESQEEGDEEEQINEADRVKVLGQDGKVYEGVDEARKLARGLWTVMTRERVLETIKEEVARESGHRSAREYAREALEAWEGGLREGKGSGRRKVIREEEAEVRVVRRDMVDKKVDQATEGG